MLPCVHKDIGSSIHEEIPDDDEAYLAEQLLRIAEINPCIANFMMEFSETSDDPEGMMLCGIMVYRMLESQSEADDMKKDLKLG